MRKPFALIMAVCIGVLGVGCEGEKKPEPKVPTSDLGAPSKSPSTTPSTTPPANK
jgi:hypothetical protein